jgi:hypothetical protein
MDEQKPNPKRLVIWAIAGSFLAASTWFLAWLPIPRFTANECGCWDLLWMNRLRLISLLGPFVVGMTVSFLAERRFKRCVNNQTWSEAQLEPVRALIAKPIWSWTSGLLIGATALSLIFILRREHTGAGAYIYMLLLPTQTVTRIRQLVTPRVKSTGGLIDWRSFKPIHSDHWGQQPIHPSE